MNNKKMSDKMTKKEFIQDLQSKVNNLSEKTQDNKISIGLSMKIFCLNNDNESVFFGSIDKLIEYIKENQLQQVVVNKKSYSLDLSTFN